MGPSLAIHLGADTVADYIWWILNHDLTKPFIPSYFK